MYNQGFVPPPLPRQESFGETSLAPLPLQRELRRGKPASEYQDWEVVQR